MDILAQVVDSLTTTNKCETENKLITTFLDSNEQYLRRLLFEMDLWDKNPSHQLLNEVVRLSGAAFPNDLLKVLWLRYLSRHTQAIHLQFITNLMVETQQSCIYAVLTPQDKTITNTLSKRIKQLVN